MSEIKPISPNEAVSLKLKKNKLTKKVVKIVNDLIVENFDGRTPFIIYLETVNKKLRDEETPELLAISSLQDLNIEQLYEEKNWRVSYFDEVCSSKNKAYYLFEPVIFF